MHLRLITSLYFFLSIDCLFAKDNYLLFEAQPSRIKEIKNVDNLQTRMSQEESLDFIYLEKDILYLGETSRNIFIRRIFRANTNKAAEDLNTIYINFNPSYQQVIVHDIRIFRHNGKEIALTKDQLKPKIINTESSLKDKIFTGRKQVVMFVPHLEKGDTVLYSYSINGSNPIYKGQLFDSFRLDFTVPVSELKYSIRFPKKMKLMEKKINTDLKFEKNLNGNLQHWKISRKKIKAKHIHNSHPKEKVFHAYIDVTSFHRWKAVAGDAERFYQLPDSIDDKLKNIISMIKGKTKDPEQRYLLALQYVEDKIHYLGLEWGAMATMPTSPDKVVEEQYGDCKAKVLLLRTILHNLGISSYPAYVDTDFSHLHSAPSPYSFDHVILLVELGSQRFWVDPTRRFQKYTKASAVYVKDFKQALVIGHPKLSGMQTMNLDYLAMDGFNGKISYDLRESSEKSRVQFTYKMNGSYADYWRGIKSELSKRDIENKIFEIISRDELLSAEKNIEYIKIDDCPKENCVYLSFALRRSIWKPSNNKDHSSLNLVVDWLSNQLPQPVQQKYLVDGRYHGFTSSLTITSKITMKFDHSPYISIPELHLHHKNYKIDVNPKKQGHELNIEFNFSSRKDYLSSADYQTYQNDLKKIQNMHTLSYRTQNKNQISKAQSLLDEFLDH